MLKKQIKKLFDIFTNWLYGEEDFISDLKRNASFYEEMRKF